MDSEGISGLLRMQGGLNGVPMAVDVMEKALLFVLYPGTDSFGPRDTDGSEIGVDDRLGRIGWIEKPGIDPIRLWKRHDISCRKRGMYDKWIARNLDHDGDLDMIGTRGNSYPFDGVI